MNEINEIDEIEFLTAGKEKRPIRLSADTRKFAWESMHGKYGDDAVSHCFIEITDHMKQEAFEALSEIGKYDACIRLIAEHAPLRHCEGELLSGSATLGGAIGHVVPVRLNGNVVFGSVSHVTLGFDRVLKLGMEGIEEEINDQIRGSSDEELIFLESLKNTVESMRIWHRRYLEYIKDIDTDIYEVLLNVPFKPAKTFREALQSLWFTFAFTRVCGNWSGIGRIDHMLGNYLDKDLKEGRITHDMSADLMAHFFIKGCEWIQTDTPRGSGDAQHYQNIVLSGIDREGKDITNEVTYLVLDTVEELAISDYPITVRINEKTDKKLLEKVSMVTRHGGGIVAVYNESLIIKSLIDYGYDEIEARDFANDGCWEVQIPGRTCFSYMPFDSLQVLLKGTLKLDSKDYADFPTYQELYEDYLRGIAALVHSMDKGSYDARVCDGRFRHCMVASVISLFEEDCIKNKRQYYEGGTKYTVLSPHLGGGPDTANSLYAIKKLVYDDKIVSLHTLTDALRANWEGYEDLRLQAQNRYTYYGNDSDEVDSIATAMFNDFAKISHEEAKEYKLIKYPPGVSTFGRQIEWMPLRCATPFGKRKGDILSGNASPTPGTDISGATSIIRSYCKADLSRQTTGSALDILLSPSAVAGDKGITVISALIQSFVSLGGFFMQLDIADVDVLKEAQKNPELYKTLSVRVSGWNARFVTLNKEWQDMVIQRFEC